MKDKPVVTVFGATGTIGRKVVAELVSRGATVRAMTRRTSVAHRMFEGLASDGSLTILEGDLTSSQDVMSALDGADGVIMTHGAPYGSERGYEAVDYGAVVTVIDALNTSPSASHVKVALMSSIGVTHASQPVLAWKYKGEQALRASGLDYAIVRPGWFANGKAGSAQLLQGDEIGYGEANTTDIAATLVEALYNSNATGTTVEVFTATGMPDIAVQYASVNHD